MHQVLASALRVEEVEAAAAAGATTLTSDTVTLEGAEKLVFMVSLGAIGAIAGTPQLNVQYSDDDSAYTVLADATVLLVAATHASKVALIEIVKPKHKYWQCVVNRGGTTNSIVLNHVTALVVAGREQPETGGDVSVRKIALDNS